MLLGAQVVLGRSHSSAKRPMSKRMVEISAVIVAWERVQELQEVGGSIYNIS